MAVGDFTVVYDLTDIKELSKAFQGLIETLKKRSFTVAIREIGLLIEREGKLILTRKGGVDTGRLRASIGHGDDGIWQEEFKPGVYVVVVGTNVEYAPYVEYGFTMNTPHVAFIKGVGFRYIHPFTFEGYHFMEEAALVAERAAPKILERQLDRAIQELGLG